MYNEHYTPDEEFYHIQRMNEEIEMQMYQHKKKVMNRLSSKIVYFSEEFVKILIYSYYEGFPTAEKMIEQLDLSKMDLFAIDDCFKEYKKEFMKEYEMMGF